MRSLQSFALESKLLKLLKNHDYRQKNRVASFVESRHLGPPFKSLYLPIKQSWCHISCNGKCKIFINFLKF